MTTILFRKDGTNTEEYNICSRYFNTVTQRTHCNKDHVIGRFSVLPYYRELEIDLKNLGCNLVNSYEEHRYIADFEWYNDLEQYTFRTWDDSNFYQAPQGAYVVKGRTNSRKQKWNTEMFAPNKTRALEIANLLCSDSLIGSQGVIYREYVPLETFEIGLNGLPFTNEYRCFFYKTHMLTMDYYWTIAEKIPRLSMGEWGDFADFAQDMAKIVSQNCNFFVIDIAKTETGKLMVVELNDGQMSGCSNPRELYRKLSQYFKK